MTDKEKHEAQIYVFDELLKEGFKRTYMPHHGYKKAVKTEKFGECEFWLIANLEYYGYNIKVKEWWLEVAYYDKREISTIPVRNIDDVRYIENLYN